MVYQDKMILQPVKSGWCLKEFLTGCHVRLCVRKHFSAMLYTVNPILTYLLTGLLYFVCATYQRFKWAFKILSQINPALIYGCLCLPVYVCLPE
jgi:hypothetical protein